MIEKRGLKCRPVVLCAELLLNEQWRIRFTTQEGDPIEEPEYELTREQIRTLGLMLSDCAVDLDDRYYDGCEVLTHRTWLEHKTTRNVVDVDDNPSHTDVPV